MTLIPFIVRDARGWPVRSGLIAPSDLAAQAELVGETSAKATAADLAEAEDARQALFNPGVAKPVTAEEVIAEALRAKGIDLQASDLAAARARIRAKRRDTAAAPPRDVRGA